MSDDDGYQFSPTKPTIMNNNNDEQHQQLATATTNQLQVTKNQENGSISRNREPDHVSHWHANCLTCVQCQCRLTLKCYLNNGQPYCREDYFQKFAKTRCAHCELGIAPNSQVRRAQSNVYHLDCFDCIICKQQLHTGDEFYLMEDNRLVCKADYDAARQRGELKLDLNRYIIQFTIY